MMKQLGRWLMVIGVVCITTVSAVDAWAIPELQVYIEGSTYDATTETWVYDATGTFTIWVIADVSFKGSIDGVKLSAAVSSSETGTVTIASTTASGIVDPSTPLAPTGGALSADGAIPVLGDNTELPTHGIYGPGTKFYEWYLGDFTLTDSPVGDFISAYPSTFPDSGQINAYTVNVTGYTTVHFDAYDHYYSPQGSQYVNAPFSHDGGTAVPEPGTLLLLGSGLIGLGLIRRKKNT